MGEEVGDKQNHVPLSLIYFPQIKGEVASTPSTLSCSSASMTHDSSCQLTLAPNSHRVSWILQADAVLIVFTWSTLSVNTQTKSTEIPLPTTIPDPGAALTAALPPLSLLHLAATMHLNPNKLSLPTLPWTLPNQTLLCVVFLWAWRILRLASCQPVPRQICFHSQGLSDIWWENWVSRIIWKLLTSSLWWSEKNMSGSKPLNWF